MSTWRSCRWQPRSSSPDAVDLPSAQSAPTCSPRSRTLRTYYRRFWSLTRWSLLGVVTTVLQAEAHSFVVTALVGPAAYAPLAAGFVLFGPVRTAINAWLMVMQPELANAVADHRRTAVVRTVFGSMIFLAAGTFVVVGLVYLLWAPIDEQLYSGRYDDQPMAFIVAACAMLTLALALIAPLSGLMLALKAFRPLALATVAGAVVSISLVLLLLMLATATATLLGVLALRFSPLFSSSVTCWGGCGSHGKRRALHLDLSSPRRATRLLKAVAALEDVDARLSVVVENDLEGQGLEVCRRLAPSYRWPLRCLVEERRGYVFPRNRALAAALEQVPTSSPARR